MKKTLISILAACLIGACGCSKKQQPEFKQEYHQKQEITVQSAVEQQRQISSKLEKEAVKQEVPELEKDFSTPITQVSLYKTSSEGVEVRTNYLFSLGPENLDEYNCFIRKDKNSHRYFIGFSKQLMDPEDVFFRGWGGAVYGSRYSSPISGYLKLDGSRENLSFLGIRAFADNMKKIRIEAQDKEQERGITYRDEFQLHTNEVNDILVDLNKLATNSSGPRLNHVNEIKIVAEPSYMVTNIGALVIYDMGLK